MYLSEFEDRIGDVDLCAVDPKTPQVWEIAVCSDT